MTCTPSQLLAPIFGPFVWLLSTLSGSSAVAELLPSDLVDFQMEQYRTCYLRESELRCFGSNRLGYGIDLKGLRKAKALSVGYYDTCVLSQDGVACWGERGARSSEVPEDLANPLEIASGTAFSCALEPTRLRCWGDPDWGNISQLDVPGLKSPHSLRAGSRHVCFIDTNQVRCFGQERENPATRPPTDLKSPREVSAGLWHSCAIDDSGVRCWGEQLGPGYDIDPPRNLIAPHGLVSGGADYACVIDLGRVHCWGRVPPAVEKGLRPFDNVQSIQITSEGACITTPKGIECFGDNTYGQLERPDLRGARRPLSLSNATCAENLRQIQCWGYMYDSARRYLSQVSLTGKKLEAMSVDAKRGCIILSGQLECWDGDQPSLRFTDPRLGRAIRTRVQADLDLYLVLGTGGLFASGDLPDWMVPFLATLKAPTDFTFVGRYFRPYRVLCVVDQGRVRCAGGRGSPQLNSIPALDGVVSVAGGDGFMCALTPKAVQCWGETQLWELQPPAALVAPRDLVAGNDHACVIDQERVWCWGSQGESGTLNVPRGLRNPRNLTAGANHTCLEDDGGIQCWGQSTSNESRVPKGLWDGVENEH